MDGQSQSRYYKQSGSTISCCIQNIYSLTAQMAEWYEASVS